MARLPAAEPAILRAVRIEPRRAAVVLGCVIALVGLAGVLVAWRVDQGRDLFDLDGERNVPATLSALLLVLAAVCVVRLPQRVVPRAVSLGLGGVLVLAALDEAFELHEKLESALDVDWQLLYLPVFVVAAALWCWLLYALRGDRSTVALLGAAGLCWVASQVLEHEQWGPDGPEPGYTWMMVTEEILELTGSALLVVALLVALSKLRAAPARSD